MNNPFRYRPSERMRGLIWQLDGAIAADVRLSALFSEGKMLGILICDGGILLAYSGKRLAEADGVVLDGEFRTFVPPVFDVTVGYFREKEEEISSLSRMIALESDGERMRELKELRAAESVKLQEWTFEQYKVLNAKGECLNIAEVFALKGLVPPAASGDCAGPKLLQYAYLNGLHPLEMAEFWYGRSPAGPVRARGRCYPSCSWKCGPLLEFMLQGLELTDCRRAFGSPVILSEDEDMIMVEKPAGMPAVPGLDGLLSLEEWLRGRYGQEIYQVHRLDQDTSGVMVFARSRRVRSLLQRQFENRLVEKLYLALVDRLDAALPREGCISLPLAPDYEDKPRQKVDPVQGKPAETRYRVLEGRERMRLFDFFGVAPSDSIDAVEFRPLTGRTHQIRVHSAHASGLGAPICGDTLYGGIPAPRLCLHAASLSIQGIQ
ncbi:MAG: RluA family pseudouridine synthase [Bacteroidales bacterium]|nr:RluA family pseudouridine synthase [Bacteroidales bacterium]